MLADRRDALTRHRVQTVNRLQRLLLELIPGRRKKDLSAAQAKAMLAKVRPRDIAGKTRRRIAAEELADLVADRGQDARRPPPSSRRSCSPAARTLMDLHGIGPVVRRPDPGRRRRRHPVRRPQPLRVLDRHRTPRRLLRRADPPPAVPGREPADEPHDPHRRDQPAPPRHRRPRLLPTQASRGQEADGSHALPQATDLRRHLPPAPRRRPTGRRADSGAGPGGHCGATQESSAVDSAPATSTLRISHFPDPHNRRYARTTTPGRPHRHTLEQPVDNRGEPV